MAFEWAMVESVKAEHHVIKEKDSKNCQKELAREPEYNWYV